MVTQEAGPRLEIQVEDIAELCRVNPLAAEQLKNIAMQRRIAELERKLAEATGGRVADCMDSKAIPADCVGEELEDPS